MDQQERNSEISTSFNNFINILQNESDRGCVIVSAAILDDILLQLLKRRLAPSVGKNDKLFEDGAATFLNFSTRIDLAYRVGLIRDDVRTTFHLIRKIRNDFAHFSNPDTFNSNTVKDRISEIFKLNKSIMDAFSDLMIEKNVQGLKEESFIKTFDTRGAYEFLLASSAVFLLDAVNDVEPIKPIE